MERDQERFYEDELEPRVEETAEEESDEVDDLKFFLELLKLIRMAINAGANVPLTNKKIIDADKCLRIIDDMEKNLPDAVQYGMKMYNERERLMTNAETTAMNRVTSAEMRANAALEKAKEKKRSLAVLDMCCGSGAIAVSIAHFLPKAKVTACDISAEALAVARKNAEKNGLGGRIDFRESDLFHVKKRNKIIQMKETFDMILSNPPYIPTDVIGTLQTEIKDHEPLTALDGGADGLDFYRRISQDASVNLKKGGFLILEIGSDQADSVSSLLEASEDYEDIEIHKDLAGLDRVVICRKR